MTEAGGHQIAYDGDVYTAELPQVRSAHLGPATETFPVPRAWSRAGGVPTRACAMAPGPAGGVVRAGGSAANGTRCWADVITSMFDDTDLRAALANHAQLALVPEREAPSPTSAATVTGADPDHGRPQTPARTGHGHECIHDLRSAQVVGSTARGEIMWPRRLPSKGPGMTTSPRPLAPARLAPEPCRTEAGAVLVGQAEGALTLRIGADSHQTPAVLVGWARSSRTPLPTVDHAPMRGIGAGTLAHRGAATGADRVARPQLRTRRTWSRAAPRRAQPTAVACAQNSALGLIADTGEERGNAGARLTQHASLHPVLSPSHR